MKKNNAQTKPAPITVDDDHGTAANLNAQPNSNRHEAEPANGPRSGDANIAAQAGNLSAGQQQEFEDHEIAAIFPLLSEPELDALAADILENGLREEILIYQ